MLKKGNYYKFYKIRKWAYKRIKAYFLAYTKSNFCKFNKQNILQKLDEYSKLFPIDNFNIDIETAITRNYLIVLDLICRFGSRNEISNYFKNIKTIKQLKRKLQNNLDDCNSLFIQLFPNTIIADLNYKTVYTYKYGYLLYLL